MPSDKTIKTAEWLNQTKETVANIAFTARADRQVLFEDSTIFGKLTIDKFYNDDDSPKNTDSPKNAKSRKNDDASKNENSPKLDDPPKNISPYH